MRTLQSALTLLCVVLLPIPCFAQPPGKPALIESGGATRSEVRLLETEAQLAKAKAALVRAENQLTEAKMALAAYDEEGEYAVQRQALATELFLAQETLRRAQGRRAKPQAGKDGQPKSPDAEAEFACHAAEMAAGQAKLKLLVLDKHTRPRTEAQLKGRIVVAEAERAAAEADYRLWAAKLSRLKAAPARAGSSDATSRSSQGAKDTAARRSATGQAP